MASPNFYNPGGLSGARLAIRSPLAMSGRIWYLCNATGANGADAGGTAGQQRTRPLVTLAQAITNASAGDTIQCLEGHAENLATTANLSKAGLALVSEGAVYGSTRATFTLTAVTTAINMGAAGIRVENVAFLAPTAAGGTGHLGIGGASGGGQVVNCTFQAANTLTAAFTIGNAVNNLRVSGCQFTSTATSVATRAVSAVLCSAGAVNDVEFDTCTFDGGAYGWSDYAVKFSSACTRLTMLDCDSLADSDIILATGSVYKIHRRNMTGSALLELTA